MANAYVLDDTDVTQLTEFSKLLEKKNQLIAKLQEEVEQLSKELLAIRSGEKVQVVIEGRTFTLGGAPLPVTINEQFLNDLSEQNTLSLKDALKDSFLLDQK